MITTNNVITLPSFVSLSVTLSWIHLFMPDRKPNKPDETQRLLRHSMPGLKEEELQTRSLRPSLVAQRLEWHVMGQETQT